MAAPLVSKGSVFEGENLTEKNSLKTYQELNLKKRSALFIRIEGYDLSVVIILGIGNDWISPN